MTRARAKLALRCAAPDRTAPQPAPLRSNSSYLHGVTRRGVELLWAVLCCAVLFSSWVLCSPIVSRPTSAVRSSQLATPSPRLVDRRDAAHSDIARRSSAGITSAHAFAGNRHCEPCPAHWPVGPVPCWPALHGGRAAGGRQARLSTLWGVLTSTVLTSF